MGETRFRKLVRSLKEQAVVIAVGVVVTVTAAVVLSFLGTVKEWMLIDVPLLVVAITAAWAVLATVYSLVLRSHMDLMRSKQIGIVWQEHEGALFKVEVLRKGLILSVRRVVNVYCKICKSGAEVGSYTRDGMEHYFVYCPRCEDAVGDVSTSEKYLKRIVKSVVEGQINTGKLNLKSNSIKWQSDVAQSGRSE